MYRTIYALIGLLFAIPPAAAQGSSPTERAQTAALNRDIAAANEAADTKYDTAKKEYDEQKSQNEAQQQHYQEEVKQNQALQQQYQEKLREYRKAYPKSD